MADQLDLSQLSDEELLQLSQQEQPADLSELSDEELLALDAEMSSGPSAAESAARGAIQGATFQFGDEIEATFKTAKTLWDDPNLGAADIASVYSKTKKEVQDLYIPTSP